MDVDLCVVITDKNQKEIDPENLFIFLKQKLLDFNVEYKPFTNISDPLKHSLIRIAHIEGECPTIDILFAHYGWEIEALENAEDLGLAFPCFSKPYLVAMKLQAGGLKDEYDILNLLSVMGQKEKEKALNLSKIVHKDKRFRKLKMLQHS
ncbi:hypothetical protein B9J78_01890 [bacterium Unc6]|nr:hypothetical protein [bacterium Unc6]